MGNTIFQILNHLLKIYLNSEENSRKGRWVLANHKFYTKIILYDTELEFNPYTKIITCKNNSTLITLIQRADNDMQISLYFTYIYLA